jgi:GNAT superfamily N-acetyltransferase
MYFREFKNDDEEQLAIDIIAGIDKGEKWIFQGADGSKDFGGFIDRLFYFATKDAEGTGATINGDIYGTYCSCIYNDKLRIDMGFNKDMPDELEEELLTLITKARGQVNSFTSIWYPPENKKLDEFLFNRLPWKVNGHKTHELTFKREDIININNNNSESALPPDITIKPFEEKYLIPTCIMLDKSLAHTFDDPDSGVFLQQKEYFNKDWIEKAKTQNCCIMLKNEEILGTYILKNSEIDIIAVSKEHQGNGLGKYLLHHAKDHIFSTQKDEPYLYCIDRNPKALRFYLREGMKITGYSGYAYFEKQN